MVEPQLQTPVALFIFNRPETTTQVFAQIRRARPRQLLVIADGARADRPAEAKRCAEARSIVAQVDWPCEVATQFSETNLGCRGRLASGLNWVFETVDQAILLEDDCLPGASFFPFCDALLERYRDDERVMMIAGTNYLGHLPVAESYCFSRYFSVWGWATWRRAWAKYDLHMTDWPRWRAEEQLAGLYAQAGMARHLTRMFDLAHQGLLDTWDFQWFYSCLFNNGLCAVPHVNLISNVGQEGVHTKAAGPATALPTEPLDTTQLRHPAQVFANQQYDGALYQKIIHQPLARRAWRRLTRQRQRAKKSGSRDGI